jgi:hypothetical protein
MARNIARDRFDQMVPLDIWGKTAMAEYVIYAATSMKKHPHNRCQIARHFIFQFTSFNI